EALERLLADAGRAIDRVLYLAVPEDVLIRRLAGRRICRRCGGKYHIEFNPPKVPVVCDRCGGELYQRDDDRPVKFAVRLRVIVAAMAPLIDFYRARGVLADIDGLGAIVDVFRRMRADLENWPA
ncbi:nucleoside monophosphate kinase, partial [Hydrogenibacillus schlegelii]|uniref:nucleoside monophosphate kinase n=1 Tax=Hydrogenibacillus schlegelii TaxID=1484 RepID=UPI0034A07E02